MANHSCNPNASAVPGFPGTLRALKDIAEGEEVTITYGKEKTKFRCRCETCEVRRARYSLRMSSTDGSAVEFLRKRVKSFGKSRSSSESSGCVEDGDDASDDSRDRAEVRSVGWFGNATSTFRRMGRGKRYWNSTEGDGQERPAKKTYDPWGTLMRSLRGGANDGEEAPSLGQRMRVYIDDCKKGIAHWLGWTASTSRTE